MPQTHSKLRRCSINRGPLPLAQALLNTTGYLAPDTIKIQSQARIRHLLHTTTEDKLNNIKSRANTAYDACPKSSHRLLKIKSGLLAHSHATSTLHKVTRPDKTTVTSPTEVLAVVHSHLDAEVTRATPPQLLVPPWEHPDNPDQFLIESREGSFLTLADMITRDTFDKTINSLGTRKPPGLDGIPNEVIKFLPLATRSALFFLLSLLAHKAYTPTGWCHNTTCLLHKIGDPTLLDNYRPIALMSNLLKLWTALIKDAGSKYADTHGILSEQHDGFRHQRNIHDRSTCLKSSSLKRKLLRGGTCGWSSAVFGRELLEIVMGTRFG
jgi:hypothetical protein